MDERKDSLLNEETNTERKENEKRSSSSWCEEAEGSEAWLLLLRVALYNALIGLNGGSFGMLYIEYVNYFNTSKGFVGWIVSIQITFTSVCGELSYCERISRVISV